MSHQGDLNSESINKLANLIFGIISPCEYKNNFGLKGDIKSISQRY